jgi:drug/metabolite transporter (DMT)-like permease
MGRVLFVLGIVMIALSPVLRVAAAPVLGVLAALTGVAAMAVSWVYWRTESRSRSGSGG